MFFFVIVRRCLFFFFFFQAEDGIRDVAVTGVQTCALPIYRNEQELAARHRAAHRDGTTTHSRWRVGPVLGLELARTAGSRGRADRASSLFRRRLPPPSSSRNNSS